MEATWNGITVAESDDTVVVEGNHYFPPDSLRADALRPSTRQTTCPWKGQASYYSLEVGGQTKEDAAWVYPEPKPGAANIRGRVAFGSEGEVSQ